MFDMNNAVQSSSQRLPRHRRARRPMSHRLSPRDRELLGALDTFPLLTAAQLCRLIFGSLRSLSYCRDRLKRLYHAHLVDRLFLTHVPHGSPLTIYAPPRRTSTQRSVWFLDHTLAVADFIVAIVALCGDSLILQQLVQEAGLRRNPVCVTEGDRNVPVIPDCYLRLVLWGSYELGWCVEVDRGSEPSRVIRRKVSRYLAFAAGPYQSAFQTTALTIVVVTTAGARRLAHLIAAVEDELEARNATDQADLFRLTSADLAHEEPAALFCARRFWIPFQHEPVSLLPEGSA